MILADRNQLLTFFFVLIFNCSWSQVDKTGIQILDSVSSEPIPGVIARHSERVYISDINGIIHLENFIEGDKINLKITGYEELTVSINTSVKKIYLKPASYYLSTTVISSSRFERPIAESAVSISLIKPKSTEQLNTLNTERLIDRVPGVQMIDGQANIRGGSGYSYGAGSRVLLMLDDLPFFQADAGTPYWNDLPLENIGQIEILKGAGSALYGSSAMNGIIHFRSAHPGSEPYTAISFMPQIYLAPENGLHWWGRDSLKTTPYEGYVSLVHRRKINSLDISGSLVYTDKKGFNRFNNLRIGRFNGFIRKRYSERAVLSVSANFNKGESSDFFYWKDSGLFEGAEGAATTSNKFRWNIDPVFNYRSKNNYNHKVISRYYYIKNGADNNQENQSHNLYAEYQLNKTIDGLGISCASGILSYHTWTEAQLYSDTSFYQSNYAGFIQMEKKLFSKLVLSAGLRYESFKTTGPGKLDGVDIARKFSGDKLLYRYGFNWNVWKGAYFRGSYGQGFRFPTIAEKYIRTAAGGLQIVPNPELEPENGRTIELGIKQAFIVGDFKGLLDLAVFESRYYNMMEFLLTNQLQFQSKNIGNTYIKGFEIENQIEFKIGEFGISQSLGYMYIDPKYLDWDLEGKNLAINDREFAPLGQQNAANSSSSLNILKYRSKHLVRYDLELTRGKAYVGMGFQYASHVEAIDWLFQVSLFIQGIQNFRMEHDHGYRIYDFRIGYKFSKLNLQINLNNAFNEAYTTRPGLMEAPRNLSFRFTYAL